MELHPFGSMANPTPGEASRLSRARRTASFTAESRTSSSA